MAHARRATFAARVPARVAGVWLPDHFYPAVSSPEQEPSAGWNGETGFIHDAVERRLANRLDNFEFYFAGPPPMTQALQEMLMVKNRVPFGQVHFDRFF